MLVLLIPLALVPRALGGEPAIRINGKLDGKSKVMFDVAGLDAPTLARLAKERRDTAGWNTLFAVRVIVDKPDAKTPPLLGSYRIVDSVVRFEPRFPPVRGIHYR